MIHFPGVYIIDIHVCSLWWVLFGYLNYIPHYISTKLTQLIWSRLESSFQTDAKRSSFNTRQTINKQMFSKIVQICKNVKTSISYLSVLLIIISVPTSKNLYHSLASIRDMLIGPFVSGIQLSLPSTTSSLSFICMLSDVKLSEYPDELELE